MTPIPSQRCPARGELIARLLLVVGGLLLSFVVLEVLLQVAAGYIRATGGPPVLATLTGRHRILSLGDSNTYGVYLARDKAYPRQLGRRWNVRHRDAQIEVLNMGYPGNNSSQVLRDLPEMLAAVQPNLVTVMIGANDFWTEPVPVEGEHPTVGNVLWRFSRTYRLLYMLAHAHGGNEVEVVAPPARVNPARTVRYGAMEINEVVVPVAGGVRGWEESLVRNLSIIATTVKAARVKLVFLTYPSSHDPYGAADALLRRAATDTGTPLVDLAARFRAFCPQSECPAIFFKDQHPTARGHAIAARILAHWFASRASS